MVDLWAPQPKVQRILGGYGRGQEPLPVYKMPHLRGWAVAGRHAYLPAIGRHEVLVVDTDRWTEVGRIPVAGQPVFVMARPDGRQVWVNFAVPDYDQRAGDRHAQPADRRHPHAGQGRAAHGVHAARRGRVDQRARRAPRQRHRHADAAHGGHARMWTPRAASSSRRARSGWGSEMTSPEGMDATDLLNPWQRDFPLVARPFEVVAAASGLSEPSLLAAMARLARRAARSAASAVCSRPMPAGQRCFRPWRCRRTAWTPWPPRCRPIPGVNHNYQREHAFNLWFVMTGLRHPCRRERRCRCWSPPPGLRALRLPMRRPYRIDLGFDLRSGPAAASCTVHHHSRRPSRGACRHCDLAACVEAGLPLEATPFEAWVVPPPGAALTRCWPACEAGWPAAPCGASASSCGTMSWAWPPMR